MQFIYVINTKVKEEVQFICVINTGMQFIYVINTKVKEQACCLYMS